MPRETKKCFTTLALIAVFAVSAGAQSAPTSGEVMRGRIMRAKALIATRNHSAAIFELENIRRETADPAVHSVVAVLLMNCYLEQGEYRRAHDFLDSAFDAAGKGRPGAVNNYYLVAGQVLKGARTQSERYKLLGLVASDKSLPNEALNDLEKMRDMLERVVDQAKEFVKDKTQASSALSLLEEAASVRSLLPRDDYDSNRWKEELADARELLASSRSVIVSAIDGEDPTPGSDNVAQNSTSTINKGNGSSSASDKQTVTVELITVPVAGESKSAAPTPESGPGGAPKTVRERRVIQSPQWENSDKNQSDSSKTLAVGALSPYATRKVAVVYPVAARSLRVTGLVRVEMVIDENGAVREVTGVSGPSQLTSAAIDAALKWRFTPFKKDGKPTVATGHLEFNFSL